jgi:hypothetical protein
LRAKTTGWGNISLPVGKCLHTIFFIPSNGTFISKGLGHGTAFITRRRQKIGLKTWIVIQQRLWKFSRRLMGMKVKNGSIDGEYFSCLALNYLVTKRARSGEFLTTCLIRNNKVHSRCYTGLRKNSPSRQCLSTRKTPLL